ncbi:hypothetical protein ACFYZN_26215 [Streptomyces sp. NPDC001777]|uniref:hypothetical protein n=1 Tax=Streptomyces sp. NPDC001777 TaxID=3364608 RepID=UPI0036C5224C
MPTRIVDTYEAHVTSDEDGADTEVERIDEPGPGVKKCRGLGGEEAAPGSDTPAHHRDRYGRMSWTTAMCADGRALFVLRPSYGRQEKGKRAEPPAGEADLGYERAAPKAVAERSAKARGCSAPVVP